MRSITEKRFRKFLRVLCLGTLCYFVHPMRFLKEERLESSPPSSLLSSKF